MGLDVDQPTRRQSGTARFQNSRSTDEASNSSSSNCEHSEWLQILYWKDKGLLTIGHNVSFPMDHPPHARFELLLIWDYWQQLKQTSQGNAEKASK